MQKINLLKESPSPNVTFNIPTAFDEILAIQESGFRDFSCRNEMGVYIIDCHDVNVKAAFRCAFDNAFYYYRESMYPVGVNGFKEDGDGIGSHRFCTMSETLARTFTAIIQNTAMLDYFPGESARFVQASKYFRAMEYARGGEHYPHYDSDYILPNYLYQQFKTRMSLVAYGADCKTGEIAFIKAHAGDGAGGKKEDWHRQATDDEIFLKVEPKLGRIVVFDHKICHSVLPYEESHPRRILRGDLIFDKGLM